MIVDLKQVQVVNKCITQLANYGYYNMVKTIKTLNAWIKVKYKFMSFKFLTGLARPCFFVYCDIASEI